MTTHTPDPIAGSAFFSPQVGPAAGGAVTVPSAINQTPHATPDVAGQDVIIANDGKRQQISVNLLGTVYQFRAPKMSTGLKVARAAKTAGDDADVMLSAMHAWVRAGFGEEQTAAILSRLDNDDDDLDYPPLMQLVERTMVTGDGADPTT